MSLTPSEVQLVQSIQSVMVEHTLARELVAEEVSQSPGILSVSDNSAFGFRILLQVGLRPGATADEISRELGGQKRRTIERLLRNFREIRVITAWTRANPKGQWTKPKTSYGKGGPLPMQYWLAGDPSNPLFQGLDLGTRISLWRARKFIVGSSEFRDHLRRSILATLRIIQAMNSQISKTMVDKIPEIRLVSEESRVTPYPRLGLEDEAAAYAALRLLFSEPDADKENLPPGETRRLSFLS